MKRLGSTPRERGSATGQSCPDIFELDDGDILIIGTWMGPAVLPEIARLEGSVAPDEGVVRVPRQAFADAAKEFLSD